MIKAIIFEKFFRALAKKFKLKKMLKYVEEPNDVDERVDKLETIQFQQGRLIEFLLVDSHPKKDSESCNCKNKQEK